MCEECIDFETIRETLDGMPNDGWPTEAPTTSYVLGFVDGVGYLASNPDVFLALMALFEHRDVRGSLLHKYIAAMAASDYANHPSPEEWLEAGGPNLVAAIPVPGLSDGHGAEA